MLTACSAMKSSNKLAESQTGIKLVLGALGGKGT